MASGTGNLTLNGATQGNVSFFSVFSTTQQFEYLIDEEGGAFESGTGQMLDASTLIRLSVTKTHAGGGDTFVNFTDAPKTIKGKKTGAQQTQDVRQLVRILVRNETGSTLTKVNAVLVTGWNTTENLPLVSLADKDTARPALGLIEADISQNSNGYVIQVGLLDGLNTSAWALNDQLMLGDAGALVNTPPSAGQLQYMGCVIRSHATLGVLSICAIQTGLAGVLNLIGGTMLGNMVMSDRDITGLRGAGFGSTLFDAGNKTGASQNINWTNGDKQRCVLTGNVSSSTFTAPTAVGSGLWLRISQDGTGSRTFAWPSNVIWDRLVTPTLSTGASVIDSAFFAWDGTNYRGSFFKGSA